LWNREHPTETLLAEHFRRMLAFDFGRSDADDTPIADRLRAGATPSLLLTIPLFLMDLMLGIGLALMAAFLRGPYVDRLLRVFAVLTMSIAGVLYIIGTQYLLGKVLRWFPLSGFDPSPSVVARFLMMPIVAGLFTGVASNVRYYRTVFLEEVRRGYGRAAPGRGGGGGAGVVRYGVRDTALRVLHAAVVRI